MVADRTSGGFGGKLRDARERRGISLRQIANATKISVGALEALERNDISRLPGGIFSRAFVRSYATEVGLDPEATIQEFVAEFPNDSPTAGAAAAGHVEDHVSVESDRKMAGTFLWLIGLSLPIAGAVLYFAAAGRSGKPQAPPPDVTTPAPEPVAPAAARAPVARAAPPVVPAAGEKLTVVLSVKRPCYVSASVDGERRIERLLQPGERQAIEVQREMVITAGDASAITLTLNGAEAKPLGKTGEVVTARFNLTNYKDYVLAR